ncbi:MAG: Mur ligase domain-containing protein, partial [Tannerella sp.]|nr:Mur ligase domain-containing protein [Tannerella sp.]
MRLLELLEIAGYKTEGKYKDIEIVDIQSDSRQVKEGSLFVAVKGTAVDGHDYIEKAIEQGAKAIVCERSTLNYQLSIINYQFILVPDSAAALGRLASAWYGEPSQQLVLVGVTGTNGKTTIATVLYHLFRKLGYKAGLLSTVCNYIDDKAVPTE